ncbi:hypothetical protein OAH16_00760, partial [bacterium]|nr:hypothetical protein [bacterium]
PETLDALRHALVEVACSHLKVALPEDETGFLNNIHNTVDFSQLNDFRLAVYNGMNTHSWFRPTYFALSRSCLECLVGNELAMQNRVNLSIQIPEDDSSLINIHADSFSGESPFQVVQWLPLVDVYDTKSMFILRPELNQAIYPKLKRLAEENGVDAWYEEVKDKVTWITVPYGKVVIFNSNLLHGNIVNRTGETRWSFNTRFKGLFTPYSSNEKNIGKFYLPITTRPVSRIGMDYHHPEGWLGNE